MNILIWIQAIGGLLFSCAVGFWVGTFFVEVYRDYRWSRDSSKRKAIRQQIARNILDVGNWIHGESGDGALLMKIIGAQLRDFDHIDAQRARQEFRLAKANDADVPRPAGPIK